MNIHSLQYFCSVAKHLNFSKAAEECHIAQTAMSRSIAAMEDELGFRLFDRTRHHVELTPAGAYFLKEAAQIVEQYNFSLQSGREISRSSSTRLDIGFGGYDMNFARFYVSRFMRLHPECSIVLREYHYDKIFGSLLSRTCDVIFTAQTRIEDEAAVRQVLVSHSTILSVSASVTLSVSTIPSRLISSMVCASSVPLILTAAGNKPGPSTTCLPITASNPVPSLVPIPPLPLLPCWIWAWALPFSPRTSC